MTSDDLDITLRALSDALIIFSERPFYPKGKLEMLPKKPLNLPKSSRFVEEEDQTRPTLNQDRTRCTVSIPHLVCEIPVSALLENANKPSSLINFNKTPYDSFTSALQLK
jgi:hypothetical protein